MSQPQSATQCPAVPATFWPWYVCMCTQGALAFCTRQGGGRKGGGGGFRGGTASIDNTMRVLCAVLLTANIFTFFLWSGISLGNS